MLVMMLKCLNKTSFFSAMIEIILDNNVPILRIFFYNGVPPNQCFSTCGFRPLLE